MDNTECFRFEKIVFEVASVENGGCCSEFKPGDRFSIDALAPKGFCPFLYHTAVPYIEATKNGASFNVPEANWIIAQCPNPLSAISVKISQKKNENVSVEFNDRKKDCPHYDYRPGVKWEITSETVPFCPRAYDSLFPYLVAASTQKKLGEFRSEGFSVTCPGYPGYIVFREIINP